MTPNPDVECLNSPNRGGILFVPTRQMTKFDRGTKKVRKFLMPTRRFPPPSRSGQKQQQEHADQLQKIVARPV